MEIINILMIEQEHLDALYIGNYLKARNVQVTTVMDIKTAIKMITKEWPDLILLDSKNDESLVFCRQMKHYHDVPIIILSENRQKMEELRALESGADDFIIKPFFLEILFLKIKAVLRRKLGATRFGSQIKHGLALIQN